MIRKLAVLVVLAAAFAAMAVLTGGEAEAAKRRKADIVIDETQATVIKGKIIRPELSIILRRSKVNYEGLERSESFVPKIIDSVNEDQAF